MTTKKKLLSYNTIKHPLVAQFFDELEDTNLASHYVRQAIEFYQLHKNNESLQTISSASEGVEKENPPVSQPKESLSDTGESDDNYVDFDATKYLNN